MIPEGNWEYTALAQRKNRNSRAVLGDAIMNKMFLFGGSCVVCAILMNVLSVATVYPEFAIVSAGYMLVGLPFLLTGIVESMIEHK